MLIKLLIIKVMEILNDFIQIFSCSMIPLGLRVRCHVLFHAGIAVTRKTSGQKAVLKKLFSDWLPVRDVGLVSEYFSSVVNQDRHSLFQLSSSQKVSSW
jgi:hypothetical protein